VEPPKMFKIEKLRNKINNVDALEGLFNKKCENFEENGQAFINAQQASWGDTFVFLKEANKDKWLVLILQSKRKASKENQVPTQKIGKDLKKVFGIDHQAWKESNFNHLLLLITDCNSAESIPNDLKQHVCVITRREHKEFYGEYRQNLRYLRDLPPIPNLKIIKQSVESSDDNFENLSVNDIAKEFTIDMLKTKLTERGLTITGKKAELIQRLKAFDSKSEKENQDENPKETKKRKSSSDQPVKKKKKLS